MAFETASQITGSLWVVRLVPLHGSAPGALDHNYESSFARKTLRWKLSVCIELGDVRLLHVSIADRVFIRQWFHTLALRVRIPNHGIQVNIKGTPMYQLDPKDRHRTPRLTDLCAHCGKSRRSDYQPRGSE